MIPKPTNCWNELVVEYLKAFIGDTYLFGGKNPIRGWDCSGLVSEGLKFAGMIRFNEDISANALKLKFESRSFVCKPPYRPGTLLFFGTAQKIEHVGIACGPFHMLEAAGGNPTTTNADIAFRQSAFVKIRLISYRTDFVVALFPPYPYLSEDGQIVRPEMAEEIRYPQAK